jgi:GNAT superfamily N-acetyltransferase
VDWLIRLAGLEDARGIAEVHVEAWRWAYASLLSGSFLDELSVEERFEGWRKRLAEPGDLRTWVAVQDGRIVGFASTGPTEDEDAEPGTMELFTLYVVRDVLGTGVGRALFESAIEDLRERGFTRSTLWVLEANELGRRFYEKAGWKPDGAVTTKRIDCENRPTMRYAAVLTPGRPGSKVSTTI